MSIMDIKTEFSDGQSIAALNNSSVVSTDVIDFGTLDLNIGDGTPVFLNVKIGTACAGGTSVQFRLYGHTTTTVNSGTMFWDSGAITVGTLVAGYEVASVSLPLRVDDAGQYIGMYYTAVGAMSAGTVDAWLSLTPGGPAVQAQVRTSNI